MKKRFLSGLLAAVMTLGLALSAFPAIIANAATAEPIDSISLADKLEEGIAAYLEGETEKTWDFWQNVTKLNFGSFNLLVESQGYQNITRAWADGTTAGIEGKMGWATDYYVEGGSGMAVISSTGSAIRFEAAYTQTQKATYIVERDGVYKVAADVTNVAYSDTNPHQETVNLQVLVNGELKDEITLAYGETGAIETEVMTLKVGDTVTLQAKSIRDNDEIHWKYKLDVAAELQVIEDLGPDASWNMHDELKAGLAALVATGTDYKGTAFSALDLGAFDFNQAYYSRAWEVVATGFKGASINGSNKDEAHDLLTVANGLVKTHADYNNTSSIVFTAPSYGKYKLIPTADLAVSGTGTSFVVTAGGNDLAIGPNGETTLAASSALSTVEVTLNEGDTIVVKTKGGSYNTYFTFNYVVEYYALEVETFEVIETYNVADSLRTFLSTEPADKAYANAYFGNFKFDYAFRSTYAGGTYGYAATGTEYQLIPTTSYSGPYIGVAADAATYAGIKIRGNYYNQENAISFVAPKDGIYTISDAVAYAGKSSLFNSNFDGKMTLKVLVNGVAQNISEEAEPTVLTVGQNSTADMPALGNIALNKGDTIQFLVYTNQSGWNERLAFVNFDVNLVKDLSPVDSWNLYDEFSSNLAALAADGTDYVGTEIALLDLGAFKLAPGYYTLVKNLSATAIGGKTTGGTNCHDVLGFSGDNVSIHTCYTNPVYITFTAPKAGAYVIDLSDTLAISGTTLASTAFEVLVNGESVAKYTAAGAMSDIEVDLNKNDTVVLKVTTGIDSSNWSQTRAIFDCTINLVDEYPVFAGANLTLKSDLSVNFAVMNDWFTTKGYTNPEIRFEVEGVETTVSTYKVQGTRAVFTLSNLSPKQMNDTITATLIATNKDGKRFAYETIEYSIAQYCYRQLENSKDAKLKVLCVDVLNYGAATQIFTDYKTDNLANANLTPEQAALATPERAYEDLQNAQSLTENKDKAAPWKGGRLMLTGAITVEFSFETTDIAGCYVEFSDGTIVTEDELGYTDGRYVVGYTKCIPANMQEVVSAVVKNANGEVISGTINYSIETYCRSKWNEKKDGELTNQAKLCRAMIAYGDATAAYAG